jgi:hypothetical protein
LIEIRFDHEFLLEKLVGAQHQHGTDGKNDSDNDEQPELEVIGFGAHGSGPLQTGVGTVAHSDIAPVDSLSSLAVGGKVREEEGRFFSAICESLLTVAFM